MNTLLAEETQRQHQYPENWTAKIDELGPTFSSRAEAYENQDAFATENYEDLKSIGFFAATIPEELGGAGLSHSQMAHLLRKLAWHSSSTALANSMHQHLVAANVWKNLRGQGAEPMLRKVANAQPVLVSTGARDWLESNGTTQRIKGGYLVSGMKHFASQSAVGEVLVTSSPFEDPENGWRVLHFAIPFKTEGIETLSNWKAMGMRSTGSNTVKLEKVFVPESAITLNRPREGFHPFYNVILTVALPYIMGVYVGIAQRAASMAIETAIKQNNRKSHVALSLGKLNNTLTNAEVCWDAMVSLANDLDFEPTDDKGQKMLTLKTLVANACTSVASQAMEIAGGQGFFRSFGLEKLFRDAQAANYHPLPEKDQCVFSGDYILGNLT